MLLDASPTILGTLPESLRRRAARDLQALGVELHVGVAVTRVDEHGIDTSSPDPSLRRIEAATKIRAAGVEASPLGRVLSRSDGAQTDHTGRVKVEPDCTLPGHAEVFVIGDLMSLDDLPGVARVAIQSGHHAAETITRRIADDTAPRPFHYLDFGTMVAISRFRAVGVLGGVRVSGFIPWLLWLVVHLVKISGFNNRVAVLFDWTVAILFSKRAQRVITIQQVSARQSLEGQASELTRADLERAA